MQLAVTYGQPEYFSPREKKALFFLGWIGRNKLCRREKKLKKTQGRECLPSGLSGCWCSSSRRAMHHPPPYIETSKGHRIEKGAVSKFKDRGTELKKKRIRRERETRSHLIPRRRTVRRTSRPVAAPFSLPAHAGMVVARTRGDKATGGDRERRDSTVQSVDVDADARLCNFFSSWSW